jgi:predicted DNA-binding transcriptional regulator AlpA
MIAAKNPTTVEAVAPKRRWTAPNRDDLIAPPQLARELGMSLRTLQRHFENKTGPARITLGKHVLYRRSTVDAWLQAHEGFTREPVSQRRRRPVSAVAHSTRRARAA